MDTVQELTPGTWWPPAAGLLKGEVERGAPKFSRLSATCLADCLARHSSNETWKSRGAITSARDLKLGGAAAAIVFERAHTQPNTATWQRWTNEDWRTCVGQEVVVMGQGTHSSWCGARFGVVADIGPAPWDLHVRCSDGFIFKRGGDLLGCVDVRLIDKPGTVMHIRLV